MPFPTSNLPIVWRSAQSSTEYEAARSRVFNMRRPERYPLGIVKPTNVSQIVSAVQLAETMACRVAIRSGGHSWACWSLRDGSLLIDLVDFKHLTYDDTTGIVEASPSTMSKQVNEFLNSKGRMIPAGHCGEVGLGGFLLQGGMGLNARSYGWGCEYVQAIDVVTAAGETKHCSKIINSDLYWASRGAGPGFPAIVTKFYLTTRPMSAIYKVNVYAWPTECYDAVMSWYIKMIQTLDEDVESLMVCLTLPDTGNRVLTIRSTAFAASEADARLKFKPLIDGHPPGTVLAHDCENTTITDEYSFQALANPEGLRYIADDVYIKSDADIVSIMRSAFTQLPKTAMVFFEPMNPTSRRPLQDMALSMQTDYYIGMYAVYKHEKDDAEQKAWMREIMLELELHSAGAYLGDADFQVRPTKFWSDESAARLALVRKKWDPKGRICGFLDHADESGVEGLPNLLHDPLSRKGPKVNAVL